MKITIDNEVYTLNIEKAKECGALTRKDNRVRSWSDYMEKYNNSLAYRYCASQGKSISVDCQPIFIDQQLTSEDAEALWALSCLMKLHRDWVGNWTPKCDGVEEYYVIKKYYDKLEVECEWATSSFLTFPTQKDAEEFIACFKDLIEMCKNYI